MKRLTTIACTLTLASLALGASGCAKGRRSTFSSTVATSSSSTTTTIATVTTSSGAAPVSSAPAPAAPVTPPPSFANPGTGIFIDGSVALPASSTDDFALAIGDFDGDGDLDLFIGANGAPSRLLRNDRGTFGEAAGAFPTLVMRVTDAHAVDVDKDGDLDLVVASNFQPVRVFENDGKGVFTLTGSAATNNDTYTYKLAVADFDGDGYPDVFMANAGQSTVSRGQNRLLLNDRTGGLREAPAGSLPALLDDSIGVVALDFDKDGDQDIYVANFGTAHRLLQNDGTGRFRDGSDTYLPPIVTYGTSVAAADFDGDGYLDLYVGNEGAAVNGNPPTGQKNTLLIGGPTRFVDSSLGLPDHVDATFGVVVLDANGDGKPDVATANLRGAQKLYLNLNGRLVDATPNLPALNTTGVSDSLAVGAADLNGDKAPDLLFLQRGQTPWLFLNVPRASSPTTTSNAIKAP
ncbi:MAG: FG-GAP repeat domain-containing protein [Planctomycetota bacterium]